MDTHSQMMDVEETVQVIVFNMGEERYGVDISQVKEIIKPPKITRIPNSPDFIEGVTNLRGQITTIINLRKRFGKETKETDNETRIIVIEYENVVIGMIVDSVNEVKYLSSNDIDELPDIITSRDESKFLTGVGKLEDGLLTLIDLDKVFSEEEIEGMKR
ncbi:MULTISPECIES: chemotaxis protein CheW [Methanohalophilus]|uniref:Chemotaxis protein CheW n=1 Tax=Methanohalophilus euhalobius TaxID=51203 RepID=A0A314ZP85_9EURY|nr:MULTISPECIES: chemotaxis protein CheW [Methanohalophilus]KXS46372.1 MAG: purine-binding chemotaxis protein CheW [Methanohalophilus sp. T328-1]RSD35430.1 MAG: purine-binding chemotaxis protein CheW [Methanohalophilus sp.]OBZ35474.1 MAG: chemotaxis protein CheW [Methanohalophilus sp. DAL1]PQV42895.1 purine-binding chemotaxis protein CheW [Methanohalophilus euhalobius]RNI10438.1 chemotaxis protein CheW [Methanohalophilus euhalobius]